MTPLVSIVIPCYNASAYLADTLDCAFRQTWSSIEVILVDDGSTDDSLPIAERYTEKGLTLLTQANRGAAAARNAGLKRATGDYIQYLDADDLMAPEKIECQLEKLIQNPKAVAMCAWGRFYEDEREAYFPDEPTYRDFDPTDFLCLLYAENRMMHPAAWLVPRPIAEEAGPWNEELTLDDDGEYFGRVVLAAERLLFVRQAETYYRSGIEESLSKQRSLKALQSQFRSTELCCERLLNSKDSVETRHACLCRWQQFYTEIAGIDQELGEKVAAQIGALGGQLPQKNGSFALDLARKLKSSVLSRGVQTHPHRTKEAKAQYRRMKGWEE